ncbi:AbrB/MazE/SpoVT family DNA-binding domain-containing protein [Desulfoscipio gibsoniae]
MHKITVSSRGQIVIPAEIRNKLDIREGDILSVQLEEGGRMVIKTRQKNKFIKGVVAKTKGILADMDMSGEEYVKNIRKGSGRRLDELEGSR